VALLRPQGVAVDAELNLYVADTLNHRLVKLAADGSLVWVAGRRGRGWGELDEPTHLAVDVDGGILAVDRANNRLQKFSADGQPVGVLVNGRSSLSSPTGVALDPAGSVYLSDTLHHRVLRLAPT
jgi:DNA-binding beta-propeller fold protein YncE